MMSLSTHRPRILIADDEPLLRAELRQSLAALWPEAEVVAEAADGYEALRLARATEPDVAFLDIRMPGLSGLEVARTFGVRTHVVFVTAYQEHALAAFDEGAIDYVLKPTDPVRLVRAIERVRARLGTPPPDLEDAGFWQIHRGYVVAVKRIAAVSRDADGALWLSLRGHADKLPVSQRFQHRFKGA